VPEEYSPGSSNFAMTGRRFKRKLSRDDSEFFVEFTNPWKIESHRAKYRIRTREMFNTNLKTEKGARDHERHELQSIVKVCSNGFTQSH